MVLQMENASFRSHTEACSLLLRTNQSNLYFSTAQHVDSLNPKCSASIFQSLHSRKQHTKWPQCFPSSFKTFNESFITYKEQKSILTWNIGRPAWPFSFQIFSSVRFVISIIIYELYPFSFAWLSHCMPTYIF